MALLTPLWPASGEALRRSDIRWIRRSLRLSLPVGCGTPLLVGLALLFWQGPILRVYARSEQVHVSNSIIVALSLTFALRAWVDCRSISLNSAGILLPQVIFYC